MVFPFRFFSQLGLNVHTGTLEALKVIRKTDFSAFGLTVREYSNFLRRLKHPNIIQTTNVIEDTKCKFTLTVMEYAEGGYLMSEEHYTENCKPLDMQKALLYFTQMLFAVKYLHSNDIIHGDLTLKNMIMSGGTVKICDMDSAAQLNAEQRKRTTPAYCAPEIITGTKSQPNYSFKSDMWALGVCLYTMIHGRLPFPGTNKFQVFRSILDGGEPELHKKLPDVLVHLLRGMLARDVKERFGIEQVIKNQWVRGALLKNVLTETFNVNPMKNSYNKRNSTFRIFEQGSTIFRRGELANTVMFILSGSVDVYSFNHTDDADEECPDDDEVLEMVKDNTTLAPLEEETIFDLDYNSATNSMSEKFKTEAKNVLLHLQGTFKRQAIRGKGATLGEISALKALDTGVAKAPRVGTCVAHTKVKVMEIDIRLLSSQCLKHLRGVSKIRRENARLLELRKDLEKIYLEDLRRKEASEDPET